MIGKLHKIMFVTARKHLHAHGIYWSQSKQNLGVFEHRNCSVVRNLYHYMHD